MSASGSGSSIRMLTVLAALAVGLCGCSAPDFVSGAPGVNACELLTKSTIKTITGQARHYARHVDAPNDCVWVMYTEPEHGAVTSIEVGVVTDEGSFRSDAANLHPSRLVRHTPITVAGYPGFVEAYKGRRLVEVLSGRYRLTAEVQRANGLPDDARRAKAIAAAVLTRL
jgi:hypothetical protein